MNAFTPTSTVSPPLIRSNHAPGDQNLLLHGLFELVPDRAGGSPANRKAGLAFRLRAVRSTMTSMASPDVEPGRCRPAGWNCSMGTRPSELVAEIDDDFLSGDLHHMALEHLSL